MAHGLNTLKRLDAEKTQVQTALCISKELRDEQVLIAVDRVKGRIEPNPVLSNEEVAIVCYGPSLKYTWEDIKPFKKIMTCSGAHRFLIDKGIIPTWHVDLDPREHKVRMLGTPHKDVEYLMASTCHPKMWDALEGYNVKLWHIFNNEDQKDVPLLYPRGEWILTGGNNVGMRCMVVARLLGYRKFHIFGMDCSFTKEGPHHAAEHLNANPKLYEVPYSGKMYYCEPVMLTYARQFFHEIDQLPDVSVKLHGEGLLQHMAYNKRGEKLQVRKSANIAFSTPITISPEYIEINRKLHRDPMYGIGGKKYKDVVVKLSEALKTHSIMDYGCGKGSLGQKLPFPIWEYDPALPGKDSVPRSAELVLCLNVLQCVEPEFLDNVLGDLVRCTRKCAFVVINTKPSDKLLNDGRNLHLIQQDKDWWSKKLNESFEIGKIIPAGDELHCVLAPRPLGKKAA